jgi:hypothetical protein
LVRGVYLGSWIRIRSASKNLSILNPKNCFSALGKMIWDIHPRSRIPDPDFTPDPGAKDKKAPDPGSGTATLVKIASRENREGLENL